MIFSRGTFGDFHGGVGYYEAEDGQGVGRVFWAGNN